LNNLLVKHESEQLDKQEIKRAVQLFSNSTFRSKVIELEKWEREKKALKYLSHENFALPVCVWLATSYFPSLRFHRFYFELRKVKGLKVERAG
jgi:hypothetical protein